MTQDGFNLKAFWQRAFAEGRKAGLVETAQEADKHTFEKALVLGVDQGEFKERLEWQQAGHSPACFAKKGSRRTAEVGIQVDEPLPAPLSRASVSVQVNCIPSVHADVAAKRLPALILRIRLRDHPLQVPLAVPLVESKLMAARFDWAEDTDQTYPIFLPSPPPRHPPSPLPRPSPSPPPLPPASPPPRHLRLRPPPSPLPGHLPSPPLPPRDFSVLRSSPAPFSSLQYRSKRSAMHGSHQSRRRRRPLHIEFPRPFSEAHSPSFSNSNHRKSCGRLKGTRSTFSPGSSALDWDSDHRLHDLSRALNALGWIRVT
ncbi:hypothetical protein CPB84DRAFT_1848831 [Gymnopilus junonius]|uniref:Uncharacterized protein n=1 Tax=Gymnopilus junonius TaxID=109634 RepID=A0A9P5NLZ6_GYMJU|nr:hypothetical protein CPB84DRAFT_1848831 [Gymnopilus junonius]